MLGRDVTLAYGKGLRPDSTPAPSIGVYVDDRGTMTALVLFDFALTAYAGAALGLVPAGGAEAAIEDRDIPDSLQENAYEPAQRVRRRAQPVLRHPPEGCPWCTVPATPCRPTSPSGRTS
nr:hypothetical protein [Angustibacter aerolatus]